MNTLYVTTFTYEMFKASGKVMIESFMKEKIEGKILICSEYFNYDHQDPEHLEIWFIEKICRRGRQCVLADG